MALWRRVKRRWRDWWYFKEGEDGREGRACWRGDSMGVPHRCFGLSGFGGGEIVLFRRELGFEGV